MDIKITDPFIIRKIEIIAEREGLTVEQAAFFCLQKVITPSKAKRHTTDNFLAKR